MGGVWVWVCVCLSEGAPQTPGQGIRAPQLELQATVSHLTWGQGTEYGENSLPFDH